MMILLILLMMTVFFEFSVKAEFTLPLYAHITLATDTEATASYLPHYCSIPKTFWNS